MATIQAGVNMTGPINYGCWQYGPGATTTTTSTSTTTTVAPTTTTRPTTTTTRIRRLRRHGRRPQRQGRDHDDAARPPRRKHPRLRRHGHDHHDVEHPRPQRHGRRLQRHGRRPPRRERPRPRRHGRRLRRHGGAASSLVTKEAPRPGPRVAYYRMCYGNMHDSGRSSLDNSATRGGGRRSELSRAREGVSVSTWLAEAAAQRLRSEFSGLPWTSGKLEDGPFSDSELNAAAAALQATRRGTA